MTLFRVWNHAHLQCKISRLRIAKRYSKGSTSDFRRGSIPRVHARILCVVWLAVRRNVSVVQGMCAPLVPPASVWMRGLAGGFFGSRCPGRPIGRLLAAGTGSDTVYLLC